MLICYLRNNGYLVIRPHYDFHEMKGHIAIVHCRINTTIQFME